MTAERDGVVLDYLKGVEPLARAVPVDLRDEAALRLGLTAQVEFSIVGRAGHVALAGVPDDTPLSAVGLPRTSAKLAEEHYREWRGVRLAAWRAFMPTAYPQSAWPAYVFDVIPLRALKAIEAAQAAGMFDAIEIWTPERAPRVSLVRRVGRTVVGFGVATRDFAADVRDFAVDVINDPVAVGVVRGRVFPIVRWGPEELVSDHRVLVVGGLRALRGQRQTLRY